MQTSSASIVGNWETKVVWINGKQITFDGFVRDLKADETEPGENDDIIKTDCKGVRHFSWGDKSRATSSLSLACCFHLKLKWVMCRFFMKELQRVRQADMRLEFDNDELDRGYQYSEDLFAQEFKKFMEELGAIEIDENRQKMN